MGVSLGKTCDYQYMGIGVWKHFKWLAAFETHLKRNLYLGVFTMAVYKETPPLEFELIPSIGGKVLGKYCLDGRSTSLEQSLRIHGLSSYLVASLCFVSVNKNVVTQLPVSAAMCAICYCALPPQWILTAGTVRCDKLFPLSCRWSWFFITAAEE